jgi:hypothetical protein
VLHVRKSGGTALKAAFAPFADEKVVLHHHSCRLRDLPESASVFVVVRDPVERFVSGFNSRLRRGRPRFNRRWSAAEAATFILFPTPNALAEALGSRNFVRRQLAAEAMRSIKHLKFPLRHWLGDRSDLKRYSGLMIATLNTLEDDVRRLCVVAGLPSPVSLPTDPVVAHKAPPHMDRHLSPRAVVNLRDWYADDVELYAACLALRREQLAREATDPLWFSPQMVNEA